VKQSFHAKNPSVPARGGRTMMGDGAPALTIKAVRRKFTGISAGIQFFITPQ
jgi:hypothetical protein